MALLTQSETLAFNGFLSSVDLGDVLEWSAVKANVADGVVIPPAPEKGKEAILAKAAQDLMSLEPNLNSPEEDTTPHTRSSSSSETPGANSSWPSFPGKSSDQQRRQHSYTYGFGPAPRHSHRSHTHSGGAVGAPGQGFSESLFDFSRSQSPPTSASSSAQNGNGTDPSHAHNSTRPSPFSVTSAPAALGNKSGSSSKRTLPADATSWPGSSSAESAKRRRPSPSAETKQPPRSRNTRASSSSSSTVPGSSKDADAASAIKPALLSPSQKRANHIQSEQKRRANIRRGYEALCEAVPALREAIKLEEENAVRADEEEKGRRRKRKPKGPTAEELDKADGRAGPKSENVVLQKTIDYLNALLTERDTLTNRLSNARGVLPLGHPALNTSTNHLDEKGVPLWEREWNGGSGWNDADEDGGADED